MPLLVKRSISSIRRLIDRVNIGSISSISLKRLIDRVNIGSITLSPTGSSIAASRKRRGMHAPS